MVRTRRNRYSGVTEDQDASVRTRRDDPSPGTGTSDTGGTVLCTEPTEGNEPGTQYPALSTHGLGQSQSAPPKRKVQRLKWTKQNNIDIFKAFYRATYYKTQTHGHRKNFLTEWKKIYPDTECTEQNICDRKRAIEKKGYLTQIELESIKEQIRLEVQGNNKEGETRGTQNDQNDEDQQSSQTSIETEIHSERRHINIQQGTEKAGGSSPTANTETEIQGMMVEIERIFNKNKIQFEGSHPNSRENLPKLKYNAKTKTTVQLYDNYIKKYSKSILTIEDLRDLTYITAISIAETLGMRNNIEKKTNKNKNKDKNNTKEKPSWQKRLENKIGKIRSDLTQMNNSLVDPKQKHRKLYKKYNITTDPGTRTTAITNTIDLLKQKLMASSKRLKRYNTSHQRKQDNINFIANEKMFYQKLEQPEKETQSTKAPKKTEIEEYWKSLWSTPVEHTRSKWIEEEEKRTETVEPMLPYKITTEELRKILKQLPNWKAPGPDKIYNYFWKHLTTLHEKMAQLIQHVITHPTEIPPSLTHGITYLKPKNKDTHEPKNYRPITCLNTFYKIITKTIAEKITKHVAEHNLEHEEQKGCTRGAKGCKEQLIIDGVITKQAQTEHRNIAVAWIDYQKAYDSIPHSWLLHILKIYKIDPNIIQFFEHTMKNWATKLTLNISNTKIETDNVYIKRGIFQGDTWSPKWFILALNPLSTQLKATKIGYKITREYYISHLFYVDDIKLYATDEVKLSSLLETTASFSKDIKMEFGIDKCASVIAKKGKIIQTENIDLTVNKITFPTLSHNETYKYLGIKETLTHNTKEMKENIQNKYKNRLTRLMRTQLNAKNKIKGINSWAIPILTYSFGVIQWTTTDLQELDRITRRILTNNRALHPNSAIERLYLPRNRGGRGLINIEATHNIQIHNLQTYFNNKETNSVLHAAIKKADKKYTPLSTHIQLQQTDKKTLITKLIHTWESKQLHSRFKNDLNKQHQLSTKWMELGQLYIETEGFMCAIQDQVIPTKNYQKYITKTHIENDSCRICKTTSETIQHITSGCPNLANTEYLNRHNLSAKIFHKYLIQKYKIKQVEEPYYKYTPESVNENHEYKVYWDRAIITDKTIPNNRPDIITIDKINKITTLIDIAHPLDHNIQKTFSEKIRKYTDLAEEIKSMWKMEKVLILPIVISVTGLIPPEIVNEFKKHHLPIHLITEMQKSTVLETCRIVRKIIKD